MTVLQGALMPNRSIPSTLPSGPTYLCHRPVRPASATSIWSRLEERPEGARVVITFPMALAEEDPSRTRRQLARLGYDRLRVDGRVIDLDDWRPAPGADWVDVVADRAVLRRRDRRRIVDSLEQALRFGAGRLDLWLDDGVHLPFSAHAECPRCRASSPSTAR